MADNVDGEDPPDSKPTSVKVDDVLKPGAVKNLSEEPESVTLQRLKNERTAYILIVSVATGVFFLLAGFLMIMYFSEGTTEEAKGRILFGLLGGISAALGVLAGKRL